MKRFFTLMSVFALALVACDKTNEPLEEPFKPEQTEDGSYVYRFTVNNELTAWAENDKLAVFEDDGSFLGAAVLEPSSAGKNEGAFVLSAEPLLEEGTGLIFQYPYIEGAEVYVGKIATEQVVASTGSAGIGAYGFSTAEAEFKWENLEATLTSANAFVKFNLTSSEFDGYSLNGVTLWVPEAEITGDITFDEEIAATVTADYAKTSLTEPATVGAEAKDVWMATLPADLKGVTVWAIVHMSKGIETVTIPVQITEEVVLAAGEVKEITLPDLAKSLAPSWYEPVETRYIAAGGNSWSYGPENTVLFTESGQEQVVEFKARGNFMKVKQPKEVRVNNVLNESRYGLMTGCLFLNNIEGVTQGADAAGSKNAGRTFGLDDNSSIKLKMVANNTSGNSGFFSNLLVLDENRSVIWGTNLWLSLGGVETKAYDGGEILDRNIGSSKVSSVAKHYTCNGAYFQWGRPFAFPWSTAFKGTKFEPTTVDNTLERSASNPFTMFRYDSAGDGDGYPWDWYWGDGSNKDRSGDLDDLWGNPQEDAPVLDKSGVKSNMDPCPKGYRVASAAILEELNANVKGELNGTTFNSTGAAVVYTDATSHHYIVYKGISWGFHGMFAPVTGSEKLGDAKTGVLAFWSNANHGGNGHQFYFRINTATSEIERVTKRVKNAAAPVRCMVDTENR